MNRGAHLRLAAVVVAIALIGPGAAAAAPVGDEYLLDLPGVETTGVEADPRGADLDERPPPTAGIVGEDEDPQTRLGALASTLSGPAGIALLIPLAAAAGILTIKRRRGSNG